MSRSERPPLGPGRTNAQVTALIPLVEAHEGLGLEEDSHSRAFRDKTWELGGAAMEGVLGVDMAFFSSLEQALNEVMNAADAAASLVDSTNPIPRLRYQLFPWLMENRT